MTLRKPNRKKSKSLDLVTTANDAAVALKHVVSGIPLIDVSPEQAAASRSGNLVPDEAMTIAIAILEANPKRFPDFDPKAIRSAIQYEQAITPLATQVTSLGQQLTKNAQKQRGDAATQTLNLYQTIKGLNRQTVNESTRAQQRQIGKLLTTHKKRRATTVTQAEAKVAVKSVKATKVAADKAAIAAAATAAAAEAADAAGITPTPALAPVTTTPAVAVVSAPVTTTPAVVVPSH
jgi:hypothetical protein